MPRAILASGSERHREFGWAGACGLAIRAEWFGPVMSKTMQVLVQSLFASVASLLVTTLASTVQAKVHTETVSYKDGTTTLEGYLAYDDAGNAKKPGILV